MVRKSPISLPAQKTSGVPRNQQAAQRRILPGALDGRRHGVVHRQRQRVLLVRAVHPHGADRPVVGDDDEVAHSAQVRGCRVMLSAPSVTLRSRPEACTAMFSAKKRASAVRAAPSPYRATQRALVPRACSRRRYCRIAANRAWRRRARRRSPSAPAAKACARRAVHRFAQAAPRSRQRPVHCWLSPLSPCARNSSR